MRGSHARIGTLKECHDHPKKTCSDLEPSTRRHMQKQSNSKKWTVEVEAWGATRARKVAKAVERERALMRTRARVPARAWELEEMLPLLKQVERLWLERERERARLECELEMEQERLWLEQERLEQEEERLEEVKLRLEVVLVELGLEPKSWFRMHSWQKMREMGVLHLWRMWRRQWSPEILVEKKKVLVETEKTLVEMLANRANTLKVDRWTHVQTSAPVVVWAQALAGLVKASPVTYDEILANSNLRNIIYSIEPDRRFHFAHHLWLHRQDYWWLIQILVPITRLPQELLHQILLIIIDDAADSPLALMRVSKLWYTIVTGIWASLKLGTTTPKDTVTSKLERNQWFLDVVVDTETDRGHFTQSEDDYQALFAAMEATSRWRSLVLETFPAQADLPENLVNRGLQKCTNSVMNRLRTLRIKFPCQMSPLLDHLLRALGTSAGEELTIIEINSAIVISFLVPAYSSIFRSVTVLSLDSPGLPNPVDLLPHLHRLESLTASHLPLPVYHDDADLPFIHTLRHLRLRSVSIQWMNDRTFHVLENCVLIFPLHRHILHTFCTTFPNCKDFSFEGYPLDILSGVSAHKLIHLSVVSSSSYKPRGSRQLARFSSQALQESRLTPRILHISIEATDEAWTKALTFMSNLEELVIHSARPSSLGVKVLRSLVVHPVHASDLGTTDTPGAWSTPVCPSLKRFGLRYRRWLRPSEHFDLIPEFMSIIRTRRESMFFLQSFCIWATSDQKEPLELMKGSWMSDEGFVGLMQLKEDVDEDESW